MNIIIGLIMIAVGVWLVWKTEAVMGMFGRISWAEEHMQIQGGSRLWYKLLGLLLIIIGMLVLTGMMGSVANAILKPLFGL